MNRFTHSTTVFALLIGLLLCSCQSNMQEQTDINSLLEEKKADFNGHVIVVVKQQDSTIFSCQKGLAKLDTKINIASASKWISASVVLSLVDQGLLSLDDSIGKFLPAFSKNGKGHPTIRQCLTHSSGFPAYSGLDYKDVSLAQLVDSIGKYVALKSKPGSEFEYGGMSYRIVGRIAEIASGKSWESLFQETIASKCDMKSSEYCYEPNNPDLGGGVCTTTSDYLNFLSMISNDGMYAGKRILSTSSVQEFFKSQINSEVRANMLSSNPTISAIDGGKPISYGLGTWIYNYDEKKELQPEIFCPGFTGTYPFIDKCRNVYGVIFTKAKIENVIVTEMQVVSIIKGKYGSLCK